jgi:hypothetical protein
MASKSYKNYLQNLKDVDRLINTHSNESGTTQGKKGLGHLTRSGVVMLCAAFEVYIEEVVEEIVEIYIQKFDNLKDFPKQLKKRVAFLTKEHKNELEVINLVGDGWKDVLRSFLRNDLSQLNTPKYGNIDIVFNRYVGIKEFSNKWEFDKDKLNDFVSNRGEIAHNGGKANYVKISFLKSSRESITILTKEIDCLVCDHITTITPGNSQPWRKRF